MQGVTPAHLAYLLRADAMPTLAASGHPIPVDHRASLWVRSVGVEDVGGVEPEPERLHGLSQPNELSRSGRADLMAGLHGLFVPLVFTLSGTSDGVRVEVGTWSAQARNAAPRLAARMDVLEAVLAGMHPSVETHRQAGPPLGGMALSGLALGVPTPSPAGPGDRGTPVDRLIRAMRGCHWAVRIIAYPLDDVVVAEAQQSLLNTARKAESAARAEGGPNPMSEQYLELCKEGMRSLTDARAVGGWQTAVYLMGDRVGYPRLAAVWRSVFAGQASRLEPVRTFHCERAVTWASEWVMPVGPVPPGPDGHRRPFECQTLLSSTDLGKYVQLPRRDTVGFSVRPAPVFDVEPPRPVAGVPVVVLGQVVEDDRALRTAYSMPVDDLTRHGFVCGVTGAGKTNTVFGLLQSVHQFGVPFLVLEPAKAEYRKLLRNPRFGADLQVFTIGDETVSPLRCNPFEVPPGTSVQMHLDLVRSLFVASFGMWDPLPQAAGIGRLVAAVDDEMRLKLADPLRGPAAGTSVAERRGPWRYSTEQEQAAIARGLDSDRARTARMHAQLQRIGPVSSIVFGIELLCEATPEEAFAAADRVRFADELLKAVSNVHVGRQRFEEVRSNALRTFRLGDRERDRN